MIRSTNCLLISMLLSLPFSSELQAQFPAHIQAELERRAAADPQLALALERLTRSADAANYARDEFLEHVHIEWSQYRLSTDQAKMVSVEAAGSGTIGSTLGSTLNWIDKDSGESQVLYYSAQSKSLPDGGLAIDVTVQDNGQPGVTTEYVFENLGAVTVLLRAFDDGTRHVARFVPVLDRKTRSMDYGQALTMSLTSAALLVDNQFAGEFTVSGEIIGINSGKAGMLFEFGLKPFADATPIGRTDGRTIRFEHQGHRYTLYSTEPITKSADVGTQWNVYVRAEPSSSMGIGSHAKTYDVMLVMGALNLLTP